MGLVERRERYGFEGSLASSERKEAEGLLIFDLDASVSDAGRFVSRMVVHLVDDYGPAVDQRPRLVDPEDCSLAQFLAAVVHRISVGVLGLNEDAIGVVDSRFEGCELRKKIVSRTQDRLGDVVERCNGSRTRMILAPRGNSRVDLRVHLTAFWM